jgi:hypothetical protein
MRALPGRTFINVGIPDRHEKAGLAEHSYNGLYIGVNLKEFLTEDIG